MLLLRGRSRTPSRLCRWPGGANHRPTSLLPSTTERLCCQPANISWVTNGPWVPRRRAILRILESSLWRSLRSPLIWTFPL